MYGNTYIRHAITFLIGILFAANILFHNTPSIDCSTEDSCYYDYYDGAPHIFPAVDD